MLTPCRPSSGQNVIKEDDTDRCISPESLHIINDISVHSLKLACTRETVWVYCFSLLTWIKLVVMGLTLSFIDFFNAKKGKMFFFFFKALLFFFFLMCGERASCLAIPSQISPSLCLRNIISVPKPLAAGQLGGIPLCPGRRAAAPTGGPLAARGSSTRGLGTPRPEGSRASSAGSRLGRPGAEFDV